MVVTGLALHFIDGAMSHVARLIINLN